ncbi:unnamed protein product, partial [Protopolystoma xenopodis]
MNTTNVSRGGVYNVVIGNRDWLRRNQIRLPLLLLPGTQATLCNPLQVSDNVTSNLAFSSSAAYSSSCPSATDSALLVPVAENSSVLSAAPGPTVRDCSLDDPRGPATCGSWQEAVSLEAFLSRDEEDGQTVV